MNKIVLQSTLLLFIVFVSSCGESLNTQYYQSDQMELVFDASKQQPGALWDHGLQGLSRFDALMRKHGLELSMSYEPIERALAHLSNNKVFILMPAPYGDYSAAELRAINRFMERGGRLVVVTEHENVFGMGDFQNQLLLPLGVRVIPWAVADHNAQRHEDRVWPLQASGYLGTDEVRLLCAAPHALSLEWCPLLNSRAIERGMSNTVAIRDVGEGRCLVIGDSEVFWNLAFMEDMPQHQNEDFLVRLFSELMFREPLALEQGRLIQSDKLTALPLAGLRLLMLGGGRQSLGSSLSGYRELMKRIERVAPIESIAFSYDGIEKAGQPYDLAIVHPGWSGSLESYTEQIARKWLILADRQTGAAEEPGDLFYSVLTGSFGFSAGALRYRSPLDELGSQFGFRQLPVSLVADAPVPSFQSGQWRGAGLFQVEVSARWRLLSGFEETGRRWASRLFFPPAGSPGERDKLHRFRYPVESSSSSDEGWEFGRVLVSDSCFIAADCEPFTNLYFESDRESRRQLSHFIEWLFP